MSGTVDGLRAARAIVAGGPPDVDVLANYAEVLEAVRLGIANRYLSCNGFLAPTEEDVRNARHLVQLVREGAPREALVGPALRAARVQTDGWALETFQSALFCIEDEAIRVDHIERIQEVLDLTLALFERGCQVAGFVPTPVDIANVRRLRQIMATDGAEVLAERLRLAQELGARLPLIGGVFREDAAELLCLRR